MKNYIFLFISLVAYIYSPESYNLKFVVLIFLLFLLQVVPFLIKKSKLDYINFYTIFYISFLLVNFFYPAILYPIDPEFFSVFTLTFNHDVINRATALACLSSSCFVIGASHVKSEQLKRTTINRVYYKHNIPTVITCVLFFAFVSTVGTEFLSGNFVAHSAVSLYILQLLTCSFTLASIIYFKYYEQQSYGYLYISLVLLFSFLFLSVGDRGPALSLLLVCFTLYSNYVKRIKLLYAMPVAFLGIFIMHVVGEGRVAETVVGNENIFVRGMENLGDGVNSLYAMTHSFVINSWTLYFGYDYVESNGLNYGLTIIKPVLGSFPFLLGLIKNTFGFDFQTSAEFFTYQTLGENASWGLGTNLVIDVYISFGLTGCMILFYLFGLFVEKSRVSMLKKNSISTSIVYYNLIGFAVYMPRTSIFMPLKFMLWTFFIFIILVSAKALRSRVIKY
ncbi:O-antigen polysaccharide polymerase Wzy-like protein [Idiomarina fontislapidosi]|uniref:Oligosaccharide repeat unit polymerase n=1 Tax=Idiomarina fontislapidosi TaxID=263723 RepID=A0A432XHW2_9GAMM|nr:O-antigen polysaccharide polymerase Wzy [Idiomarina fontislapidosi]PYE30072.1 O-antigen polysaccharide polymerase Wzy-like protein [Idiomarina fontislapidosi]RUO48305.1 hypothetical protein CWE25_13280 [Idiomarina fontislapidosi]